MFPGQRAWEGAPLGASDFVISADEKPNMQARSLSGSTLPVHASWLSQIEIYFSIVQTKSLHTQAAHVKPILFPLFPKILRNWRA